MPDGENELSLPQKHPEFAEVAHSILETPYTIPAPLLFTFVGA